MIPEPSDGTRLAVFASPTVSDPWCGSCLPEWLVVWRDDTRGVTEYVVPDGGGCWFSDQFECVPWSEIGPHIVKAYTLVPYDGGTE